MLQKNKLTSTLMAIVAIMGISLQSCCEDDDCRLKVYSAPKFTATNTDADGDKALTARDDKHGTETVNYTVSVTINGETQTFTGTYSSNELPVITGNEVEIVATFDDNAATSYVCFMMPDGSRQTVSEEAPVCKWTVSDSFSSGDKIIAQWADKSGKIKHSDLSSSITLIALEQ